MLTTNTHSRLRRVALCAAAMHFCGLPLAANTFAQPAPAHEAAWRHTAQGWERSDTWAINTSHDAVAPAAVHVPHPALAAIAMAATSIAALWVLEKRPAVKHSAEHRQPHFRRKTDRPVAGRSRAAISPTRPAARREIFAGERARQPSS
jgi:hypothetical protein